jgi:hypothetical protein
MKLEKFTSELLFNVLIDSSKYLSFVGLGIQSNLFLTNSPPISSSSSSKGNAVVILDREYYRDKILDMLKDGMYYEKTDKTTDQKTYKMITKSSANDLKILDRPL